MNEKPVAYIRRKNKYSYAIEINQGHANLKKTIDIICQKQKLVQKNISLYQKGQQTAIVDKYQINNGTILHLIDLEATRMEELTITVKYQNTVSTFSVQSSSKIKELIMNKLSKVITLPYFHIGLIYLGKILHPQKTFKEELVENQSEILMVDIKNYINKQGAGKIKSINDVIGGKLVEEKESQNQNILKEELKVVQSSAEDEKQSDMPLEAPKFKIQVSEVDSVDSEEQDHNRVQFNEEEQNPIKNLELEPQQDPSHPKKPQIGLTNLKAGDLIMTGPGYKSQTQNFLSNLLNEYHFMFQQ